MMGTTLTMLRIMTQRDSKSGDPPPTPSATIDFCQPSMTAAHTSTLLTIDCSLNLLPNVPSDQNSSPVHKFSREVRLICCSEYQNNTEIWLIVETNFRADAAIVPSAAAKHPIIDTITPFTYMIYHFNNVIHYIAARTCCL